MDRWFVQIFEALQLDTGFFFQTRHMFGNFIRMQI